MVGNVFIVQFIRISHIQMWTCMLFMLTLVILLTDRAKTVLTDLVVKYTHLFCDRVYIGRSCQLGRYFKPRFSE
jgi:hypothetical protein